MDFFKKTSKGGCSYFLGQKKSISIICLLRLLYFQTIDSNINIFFKFIFYRINNKITKI